MQQKVMKVCQAFGVLASSSGVRGKKKQRNHKQPQIIINKYPNIPADDFNWWNFCDKVGVGIF